MAIRFRVLSPMLFRGERVEPGTTIDADELEAVELADCLGIKTELADPERDMAKLRLFQQTAVRNALKAAGPLPRDPGSPWLPWH